jgi:hypothetical protein
MITSASHSSPTLAQRKNYVWVYPYSDKRFTDNIPEVATLAYEKDKKGNIKWVTFNNSNSNLIRLECIAAGTLRDRKKHCVLPHTDNEYKKNISEKVFRITKTDKNGHPKFATIIDDSGTEITLECITAQTLRDRKLHWVKLGTDEEYQGDIPAEALKAAKPDKYGKPKFATIEDVNGTPIQLECITAATYRKRKALWVVIDTDIEHKANIPAEASTLKCHITSTRQTTSSPIETLAEYLSQPPESNASISQTPTTSNTVNDEVPQYNLPLTPLFEEARYEARLIWVYQGSCIVYDRIIPDYQSWKGCLRDDSDQLLSILIEQQDGGLIWLEQITTYALSERLHLAQLTQDAEDRSRSNESSNYQQSSPCSEFQSRFNSAEPPLKQQKI